MRFTDATRRALAVRREKRDMTRAGWEKISCSFGIGSLWELERGARYNHRIVEAKVGCDGKSVWVKVGAPRQKEGKDAGRG